MSDKVVKLPYKLNRDFFNGKVLVKRGSVDYFVKGAQPKTATLVEVVEEDLPAEEPVKAADEKKSDK